MDLTPTSVSNQVARLQGPIPLSRPLLLRSPALHAQDLHLLRSPPMQSGHVTYPSVHPRGGG